MSSDPSETVLTMQISLITECTSGVWNLSMLIWFLYKTKQMYGNTASNSKTTQSNSDLIQSTLYLSLFILIFGVLMSITLLIENFISLDCTSDILAYIFLIFFGSHRSLCMLLFCDRLLVTFNGSSFQYKIYKIRILQCLCIIWFILFETIAITTNETQTVNIQWYKGNNSYMCYFQLNKGLIIIMTAYDFILQILLLALFLHKLCQLEKQNTLKSNDPKTSMDKMPAQLIQIKYIMRKVTILTAIALCTSWLTLSIGYAVYRPFAAFAPLDSSLNSMCILLMFQFNNFLIKPCVGEHCDECYCYKCKRDANSSSISMINIKKNIEIQGNTMKVTSPPTEKSI
eukprot:555360_1